MRWSYERLMLKIDEIQNAYIDDKISFSEKNRLEQQIFETAGWTYTEMMIELEKRIDAN